DEVGGSVGAGDRVDRPARTLRVSEDRGGRRRDLGELRTHGSTSHGWVSFSGLGWWPPPAGWCPPARGPGATGGTPARGGAMLSRCGPGGVPRGGPARTRRTSRLPGR